MYNGYGCCMQHVIPLELNAMDQLKFMFVSMLFCFYIYFDFKPIVFDQCNMCMNGKWYGWWWMMSPISICYKLSTFNLKLIFHEDVGERWCQFQLMMINGNGFSSWLIYILSVFFLIISSF